jgi:NIMA-interacting peptidyl-prolyl cis-trans isomerase 4
MPKNDKKGGGGKGKGGENESTGGAGGGKAKGAQSINVRHILVGISPLVRIMSDQIA